MESICFQMLSLGHSIEIKCWKCFDWELCSEKKNAVVFLFIKWLCNSNRSLHKKMKHVK